MHDAFGSHIYTFSYVPLTYSLSGRQISVSLLVPINFNIIHTCVSIHNNNAYLVLGDSQNCFHLAATSMITYEFFDWKTYCQELHSICMYVCIYMCAYIYIHTFMQFCLYPSIHTCLPTSIHTDSCMYVYIHAYIHV